MNLIALLATIAAGWLAGGLANLAADRLPAHRTGSSLLHCNPLHYWTLPWFFFRAGRCPGCGAVRPWRAPALETATIAAFLLTQWLMGGNSAQIIVGWLYATFLLTVLVIDFEHRRVLNIMLAPATVVVLALSLLPQGPGLAGALLGGIVGFGLFWLLYLFSRGALGAGDVKLAGVIGLMVGYPAILPALAIAAVLAAVVAVGLLMTRRATLKSSIAYAPYLAIGALWVMWFYP